MVWIRWAFKNLLNNRRRTIGILFFITVTFTIVFVNLMFLAGTNYQMKEAISNNRGDLNLFFKDPYTNPDMYFSLSPSMLSLMEDNIRIFRTSAQLIGSSGYANGNVIGTETKFLKYLQHNVSWLAKPTKSLHSGSALIEAVLAEKLNVKKGDLLTIQVRTVPGVFNTVQVKIDGIFIGSNLIYGNSLFINIQDMNQLWLAENFYNELRFYFKKDVSIATISNVFNQINTQYFNKVYIFSPKLDITKDNVFSIFRYYRFLIVFLLTLLNIVFIVILYFAVNNLYFLSFRARRQEISTLLTYGMKPARIKLIVFWEAILIFSVSFLLSIVLTAILETCLKNFSITDPSLGELITAIGGPHVCFLLHFPTLLLILGLLFCDIIFAAYKGVNTYLKVEVREITSGI
jgi:ABC-type lipoprotein release transport system permease subunit